MGQRFAGICEASRHVGFLILQYGLDDLTNGSGVVLSSRDGDSVFIFDPIQNSRI